MLRRVCEKLELQLNLACVPKALIFNLGNHFFNADYYRVKALIVIIIFHFVEILNNKIVC